MKMGYSCFKVGIILTIFSLALLLPVIQGWGTDGHFIVCRIAQSRLSEAAADALKQLLPESAENDLASVCSWADNVKFRYHWSSALHYIDTPDSLWDCKDENGEKGRCVAGAINNYTSQLITYNTASSLLTEYNLTEALLFLSHFIGDIHQPLHVGFTSDRGGNTIDVHWYTRKQVLHHVWDANIIETAEERFYNSNVDDMIDAIQQNITTEWTDLVQKWETCSRNKTACPDIYASESIKAACDWAYKGVTEGSVLEGSACVSSPSAASDGRSTVGVILGKVGWDAGQPVLVLGFLFDLGFEPLVFYGFKESFVTFCIFWARLEVFYHQMN
ncbi:endonuclease 2 isoform X2 [Hevea brasiliensis]|uniref:endonuclease 2 isoform X2 n=1 Tax=Hevea brasiliensis TaxID=3981 RepID=UPI0025CC6B27|nr:endonuclease 2 isoform X2 [Hevea brasiliensis]